MTLSRCVPFSLRPVRELTPPLPQLVHKLVPEVIGREIEKSCQGIYPLQNVFVRKVKILKGARFHPSESGEPH